LMKIRYQVIRTADQKLLCEGETTHLVVNRAMEKRLLPEQYEAAFRKLLEQDAEPIED